MTEENQKATKKCPFCAEDILAEALKCKHCGEWLNRPSILQEPKRYSNVQPAWKLVLLSILTFSVYEYYWFYRNWKQLKIHKNLDISPGWRTVGLFVPIYYIFLIYRQFKDIKDYASWAQCKTYSSPGWITFGYISMNAISVALAYPLPFWNFMPSTWLFAAQFLVSLLGVGLLVIVQNTLNEYWKKEQPELEMKKNFSNGETALIIFGVIFWILVLIGIFMPETSNSTTMNLDYHL